MSILLSAVDQMLANKFQLFINFYWLHRRVASSSSEG